MMLMVAYAAIDATSVRRCSNTDARIMPISASPKNRIGSTCTNAKNEPERSAAHHEPHPATQSLEQEPPEVDPLADRGEAHRHHGVDHEPGARDVLERRRYGRPVTGDGADDLGRDRDRDRSREHGPEPRTDPGEH